MIVFKSHHCSGDSHRGAATQATTTPSGIASIPRRTKALGGTPSGAPNRRSNELNLYSGSHGLMKRTRANMHYSTVYVHYPSVRGGPDYFLVLSGTPLPLRSIPMRIPFGGARSHLPGKHAHLPLPCRSRVPPLPKKKVSSSLSPTPASAVRSQ